MDFYADAPYFLTVFIALCGFISGWLLLIYSSTDNERLTIGQGIGLASSVFLMYATPAVVIAEIIMRVFHWT